MDDVKVSVIIPVYNTEEYLNDCLDSIVNQTLKEIEVICVNDGSTDNSLNILEEYANNDDRVKIITQPNSGQGLARNKALKAAKGKYVYYIDSDDFVELNALEELYDCAEENNLDIIMFQMKRYIDETGEFDEDEFHNMEDVANKVSNKVFDYTDIREYVLSMSKQVMSKFFRREFLLKSDAKFADRLIFQDTVFCFMAILQAERMYFIPKHYGSRRIREGSVTQDYDKRYPEIIPITDRILNVFRDLGLFDEFEDDLYNHKISEIFNWFNRSSDKFKEVFILKAKEHFQLIKEDEELYNKYLNGLNKRNKMLFENTLEANNLREFYLLMKISFLHQDVGARNNKINSLKDENKKLKEFNNSLLNSTSWKITSPLRKITNKIRKILN